jgi:hypothetical protein
VNTPNKKDEDECTAAAKTICQILDKYCPNCGAMEDGDYLESVIAQRDNLLRIIHHMRRIALPYPQWEQWWAQLGGEVVAVERTLAEQEEGDE